MAEEIVEEWRPVVGYEGYEDFYEVSNLGNVRSVDRYVGGPKGIDTRKGALLTQQRSTTGYAQVSFSKADKKKRVLVSRLVAFAFCGLQKWQNVDHIDRDPSNNAASNLRPCDNTQNTWNTSLRKDNTSGYKGVSWFGLRNKWVARIKVDGVYRCLGYFKTAEEAHAAYSKAARAHFGEFANPAVARDLM